MIEKESETSEYEKESENQVSQYSIKMAERDSEIMQNNKSI